MNLKMKIMNTKTTLILLTILFVFLSCKKDEDVVIDETKTNGLEIEITGLRSNEGVIQLELTDENDNYLQGFTSEIENNKSIITILNLSYGKYAFKYFHDKNSNKELDTNLGIPQEGYGFSNNATGIFGPPKIEDMIFEYNEPLKMTCTITYLF